MFQGPLSEFGTCHFPFLLDVPAGKGVDWGEITGPNDPDCAIL